MTFKIPASLFLAAGITAGSVISTLFQLTRLLDLLMPSLKLTPLLVNSPVVFFVTLKVRVSRIKVSKFTSLLVPLLSTRPLKWLLMFPVLLWAKLSWPVWHLVSRILDLNSALFNFHCLVMNLPPLLLGILTSWTLVPTNLFVMALVSCKTKLLVNLLNLSSKLVMMKTRIVSLVVITSKLRSPQLKVQRSQLLLMIMTMVSTL